MKTYCLAVLLCVLSPARAELKVYFGNLHSHTRNSDGSGTPTEAYTYARDVAKLDFLAITEHNHIEAENGAEDREDGILIAKTPALYEADNDTSNRGAAKKFTENGRFVAIYGQEFSTISKGNHVNVFEVDRVITVPKQQYGKLVTWLATHKDSAGKDAIIQFNHPYNRTGNAFAEEYGRDDFTTQKKWIEAIGKHACTIEILNGPATTKPVALSPTIWKLVKPNERYEEEFFKFVGLGFKLAPVASQDNHYKTWGARTDVASLGNRVIPFTGLPMANADFVAFKVTQITGPQNQDEAWLAPLWLK